MVMFTALFSLQLLLLLSLLFISTTTSSQGDDQQSSYSITDDICTKVNCGKGTCVPDLYGLSFHCECNPGWKAIQIGPFFFPSCVPNCTLNFTCGSGSPLAQPIFSLPPLNVSSPCNMVWCGDGNCVVNGTEHYCQCNNGSTNLLDNPAFACFRKCHFGIDCHHLDGVPQPPLEPPLSTSSGSPGNGPQSSTSSDLQPPPGPQSSTSFDLPENGSREESTCWRVLPKLITAILTTTVTFLTWI